MLGVHFAITPEQEHLLLAAADEGDADKVEALLEDLEEAWDDDALTVDTDRAWDAIHRCLTGGALDREGSEYPLSHAVLGGRHLHDDRYVVYVTTAQVEDVAQGLRGVDRAWLRDRFDAIADQHYRGARDDADFNYIWDNFVDVTTFYDRAAAAARSVIFTAG